MKPINGEVSGLLLMRLTNSENKRFLRMIASPGFKLVFAIAER